VTIAMLTSFFMWCTIINGSLLIFWGFFIVFMPNLVFQLQRKLFPISRETFDVVIYSFMGIFKLFFIFFNVTPYIVLLIIG